MSRKSKSSDLSLLKIDLHDLVKQICLKDLELFKDITREELDSFHWTKSSKKSLCPKLMMSTKQFNKINLWVQKEILDHVNNLKEVKVLSKFIKLSKCLLDYHNFQSAYAVKAALDSTPIHRLELLWSRIEKKHRAIWDRLCTVFSVENNYQNLRTAMSVNKLPLIPFLGVYLCDLTGLDAAHPKIDGTETAIRRNSMEKIYDIILYYQTSHYDFKQHHGIQNYLQSMEYIEELEYHMLNTFFEISKELEPNANVPASDSSRTNSPDTTQRQVGLVADYSPIFKKRGSPAVNRGSYRVITEDERKRQPLIIPDSPTITNINHSNSLSQEWDIITVRNLLDDSEFIPQNGNSNNHSKIVLHHTNSTSSQSNLSQTKFGISPSINITNHFGSFRKPEVETKSFVQYNDPDLLASNQNLKPVLAGLIKRKIKSKSALCISTGYQRVLAKLFINQLECCLHFHSPKTSKARCIEDFREEYNAKISLIDAIIDFEPLINDPKLYLRLSHETYVIQSVDDDHNVWPTLQTWWTSITDSISAVSSSKAAICQPQCNLINLTDEFTRL